MARLPSGNWLIQQIGDRVILFQEGTETETEIVNYDVTDRDAMSTAAGQIYQTDLLSEEDKAWAHVWQGYFFALSVYVS